MSIEEGDGKEGRGEGDGEGSITVFAPIDHIAKIGTPMQEAMIAVELASAEVGQAGLPDSEEPFGLVPESAKFWQEYRDLFEASQSVLKRFGEELEYIGSATGTIAKNLDHLDDEIANLLGIDIDLWVGEPGEVANGGPISDPQGLPPG